MAVIKACTNLWIIYTTVMEWTSLRVKWKDKINIDIVRLIKNLLSTLDELN